MKRYENWPTALVKRCGAALANNGVGRHTIPQVGVPGTKLGRASRHREHESDPKPLSCSGPAPVP